jgi:glycine oxidase
MIELQGLKVTVAGAGVLGLTTAVRLAGAGASVRLCDPAALGDNASGVAAGMLAPAFETALDAPDAAALPALIAARDLWPALVEQIGGGDLLDRSGAVLVGSADEEGAVEAVAGRIEAAGLSCLRLGAAELRRLQPGLAAEMASGVFTPDDWRLSPPAVLAALAAELRRRGGRIEAAALGWADGRFTVAGEPVPEREAVVVAAGAEGTNLAEAAPELAVLGPVKGQILHFRAGPAAGPVVRDRHGYVAPQAGGAVAGATMEAGRRDRRLDPETLARLRERAARLFPALAAAQARGEAGVRAATPDGLPIVGRSAGPAGALLCTGARRNGWLLAPLAAEVVLSALAGADPGPFAALFDPRRFD